MGKYVIQLHDARHLHCDFRLQVGRVLKSWVLPKGPSLAPREKRLAVLTEDHSLNYANFEGVIPEGHYGAGKVLLWDKGTFKNIKHDDDGKLISMERCFEEGRIEVLIDGKKLRGGYALIRFRDENWLLIKKRDECADDVGNIVTLAPRSVKSKKTLAEIK